ncbi:MAG: hypothetical protein K2M34_05230 [Alphaproteobacteria bacterium]|nr:hypothetical protein [Alphaproteobacteria bacterium]
MKVDFTENYVWKMRVRRRQLLRAFVINLVLIALIWLLTFVPGVLFLGVIMTGLSATMMHFAIIGALGLWGMLNFAFFLVPAIAIGGSVENEQ